MAPNVELYSPDAQAVQLVAPLTDAYVPALHGEHVDAELAVAMKEPGAHSWHEAPFKY
jgi:hypothetical protein